MAACFHVMCSLSFGFPRLRKLVGRGMALEKPRYLLPPAGVVWCRQVGAGWWWRNQADQGIAVCCKQLPVCVLCSEGTCRKSSVISKLMWDLGRRFGLLRGPEQRAGSTAGTVTRGRAFVALVGSDGGEAALCLCTSQGGGERARQRFK